MNGKRSYIKTVSKGFETMYGAIWGELISKKKDTYVTSLHLSVNKVKFFLDFIEKNNLNLEIISVERYMLEGKPAFKMIIISDVFTYGTYSHISAQIKFLQNTFCILWYKLPNSMEYMLEHVLNLNDVTTIKRSVKDKKRVLNFEFKYLLENRIIVFEYKDKTYYLDKQSGVSLPRSEFYDTTEQMNMFNVPQFEDCEHISFCRKDEEIFKNYLLK